MKNKAQLLIIMLRNWLLGAIIIFVPLLFGFYYEINNIFELNKIILFRELLIISLMVVFIQFLLFQKFLLKKGGYWLALLWLVFSFLVLYFSLNRQISFFGSYERDQGFLAQIYYLIFLLVAVNTIEKKDLGKYIFIVCVSSFLVGVYSLFQAAGMDLFNFGESGLDRSISSIGQPNFLAQYLLLVIFLPIYLFIKTNNVYKKCFYALNILVVYLAIFFTYSRGGWFGLLFGILLTGGLFLYFEKPWEFIKKNRSKILLCILCLLVCLIFLAHGNESFNSRIKNAFDYKKSSLVVRFTFWENSIDLIKKRPWLGYGLENQRNYFIDYYRKDWAILGDVNQYPDRAHNIFLDTLLVGGIIGSIIVFAFFSLLIGIMVQNIKRNKEKVLNYLCLASVVSYIGSLLFSFQTTTDGVIFWLIISLVVISSREKETVKCFDSKKAKNMTKYAVNLVFIILIIFLTWLSRVEFKKLLADLYFYQFKTAVYENDVNAAINLYRLVKQNSYYRQNYYDDAAVVFLTDQLKNNIDEKYKIAVYGILKEMPPDDWNDIFEGAKKKFIIYSTLAFHPQPNSEYKEKADIALRELLELNSEMPVVYRLSANYYCQTGDLEKSVFYSLRALSFLPDLKTAEANLDHTVKIKNQNYFIYKDMGNCYLKNRKYDEAGKSYLSAYKNHLTDIVLLKKIADTYVYRQLYDQAIEYLLWGERRDPSDHAWPYAIAQLYAIQNNEKMALPFAEKALSLSPDDQELINFIKKLKTN